MDSRSAAHVLTEIATLLELKAENQFKSRAFRGAARAVLSVGADDLAPLLRSGELAKIRGIGKSTLSVIEDLVQEGESRYLEQLRMDVPEGIIQLMRVPGLGPEKILALHGTLGIQTMDDLEAAARDGRLAAVKGFGPKSAERILDGIALARRAGSQMLYPRAYAEAAQLLGTVRQHPDVITAEIAGSVRRCNEVVSTIDIVAATRANPADVATSFARAPGVADGNVGGGSAAIRYVDGTLLNLHCVTEALFPIALWNATGNETHVAEMLQILRVRGFGLDAGGLLDRSRQRVPLADEQALYAVLGLEFVPPEMREGLGELDAAARGLPQLVTPTDIRGILHCHSTYSDGVSKIADLAQAARARGWAYLGISDHSQSAFYAGGMSVADVDRQHDEIDALNATFTDFTILKGIEADIRTNGELDYDDATLDRFDYVIGSVHSQLKMSQDAMTSRIMTALDHPRLTILGHPTGRKLLIRDPYPVDVDAIIEKAAANHVAIELNADPRRLDLDWRLLRRAKEHGVTIEIGPDAHSVASLDNVAIGIGIARKAWLESDDILNARSAAEVKAFASAHGSDADIPF